MLTRISKLNNMRTHRSSIVRLATCLVIALTAAALPLYSSLPETWDVAKPEDHGMRPALLDALWNNLESRNTTVLLVIRNDRIVYERYAPGFDRHTPHYTASLAKALVGGVSLMLAMDDGCIRADDPACRFVPAWRQVEGKKDITIAHLATHTSGIEDSNSPRVLRKQLTDWKSTFWKRQPPPNDPFTISRDSAPILDKPGMSARYSNPGFAMLGYCITASLSDAKNLDLRSYLRERVLRPLGIPDNQFVFGYDETTTIDGLPLVATWGGGEISPDATARIGRLLMHQGNWQGRRLISSAAVKAATTHAGQPNHSGLGWWVNRRADGGRLWHAVPDDAFWGLGHGGQLLLVIPSLDLIVVRHGSAIENEPDLFAVMNRRVARPLMEAFEKPTNPPYPPSPVIARIEWSPKESIVRQAEGSDNWPLTWADDDAMYSAYGDGNGVAPYLPEKLSLGFVKITGDPVNFIGENIRPATGEERGDNRHGIKASGMLMVDGVLYALLRNADNSLLSWSTDHAKTWTQNTWRFTESFGCPSFLNFGRNYAGARDDYVYIYSTDAATAYMRTDHVVLARVIKNRIRDRSAYEFFVRLDANGAPVWSTNIADRGPVFRNAGACYRMHVTYNPGLKRYLLTMTGKGRDTRFLGGFGVYDAPEPWGPWTTAYFTDVWDVGPGESSSFPSKWFSGDGREGWFVFSGDDCFSARKARFILRSEK